MATECYTGVFGNPITDATLKGMSKYAGKSISQKDKAIVAKQNKEEGNPTLQQHVQNLTKGLGVNTGVFTICLVHNLTGDTVTYVTSHVWDVPAKYPSCKDIENGQTAVFMQNKTKGTAVVYRGKNSQRDECDFMLAWYNVQSDSKSVNKVYAEIKKAQSYDDDTVWDGIFKQLDVSGATSSATWNGCTSFMTISSGAIPTLNATLTLSN
ncbi:23 kDa jasmonate-induced protein-like [Malania oleifera]|uniref:23 kDa jasmonate-induced protein-like n=1 Tax=Malania oleifera TaxID=397392 RepID=UPI0025AD9E90|nr:23 kDa jasmonate-induced protein-like [Malania oleifera]